MYIIGPYLAIAINSWDVTDGKTKAHTAADGLRSSHIPAPLQLQLLE